MLHWGYLAALSLFLRALISLPLNTTQRNRMHYTIYIYIYIHTPAAAAALVPVQQEALMTWLPRAHDQRVKLQVR